MTTRDDVRLCAYPWDVVGDPAAAERLAATGAGGVAMAAVYHSVRAATVFHPRHRVVDAASAAVYFPVREEAWAGRALRPSDGSAWAGEDAFATAATALEGAGLAVEPWVVLTHSTAVGSSAPGVCAVNAFGDVYPYALCPSHEEVVEYAATAVSECARATGAATMMVEACGPLGFGHLGRHEKTQGADWSRVDEALLSICFCSACSRAYAEAGLDVPELRTRVRSALGREAADVDAALGELAAPVLAVRVAARRRLGSAVRSAADAAGVRRFNTHVQLDEWATGPFAGLDGAAEVSDGLVLPGDLAIALAGADPDGSLDALRAQSREGRVGAYLNALPPFAPEDVERDWPRVAASVDDLYLYHAGLLSRERLDAVTRAIAAMLG